jgi:AcrR family transcriptional regulator
VFGLSRQNKKESVAALHKENILSAAEKLFLEKGVASTTIDDISNDSEYSKRTIYAYYTNKDDILYHVILKGLVSLKQDLIEALQGQDEFLKQYRAICNAMEKYQANSHNLPMLLIK